MLNEEQRKKIDYLNQYKYLDKKVDRRIRELENWKNKIFNVTGTISDMPKSNSRADSIATGIANINELEQEINKDIDKLVTLKKDIENKINKVKDIKLREILESRYFDNKRFEQIAVEYNTSIRHIFRLHESALDEIRIN